VCETPVFFPFSEIHLSLINPFAGKHKWMLDCEAVFPVEFKLFHPEIPDPSARFVVQISRLYLVKHVKTILCRAFSLPSDQCSQLLAQSLPCVKHGLRVLQVIHDLFFWMSLVTIMLQDNLSWESQGIIGPATVVCYCSPVPDIKLAVFVKSQFRTQTNGKHAISEMRRIVNITFLDDTVAHFRNSLRSIFSGKKPDGLTIIDDCGIQIELQDFAFLKDCNLMCFQTITAHFLSNETNEPECVSATIQRSLASSSDGFNCEDLRKCAGKRFSHDCNHLIFYLTAVVYRMPVDACSS
jgi:hypothetical protein